MTEKQKMILGQTYSALYDEELTNERTKSKALCFEYNRVYKYDYPKSNDKDFNKQAKDILKGHINFKSTFDVEPPFYCDYGYRITAGDNFYANHNCVLLDAGGITFGDNVLCGANLQISTLNHAFDKQSRAQGIENAKPVKIGNDVWIGGNVVILGGVEIGDNTIIGAGSVVVKSIPANSVAVGNPCKVIRENKAI